MHLNGIAHHYLKNRNEELKSPFDNAIDIKSKRFIELLSEMYSTIDNVNGITFSWEKHSNDGLQYPEIEKVHKEARRILTNAKVLVIIGYSFPFFNREIDRFLFNGQKFDKVYIQDINPENIKEHYINMFSGTVPNNQVILYKNLQQFLLPNELDGEFPPPANLSGMFR